MAVSPLCSARYFAPAPFLTLLSGCQVGLVWIALWVLLAPSQTDGPALARELAAAHPGVLLAQLLQLGLLAGVGLVLLQASRVWPAERGDVTPLTARDWRALSRCAGLDVLPLAAFVLGPHRSWVLWDGVTLCGALLGAVLLGWWQVTRPRGASRRAGFRR